jgi:hypothetical protein
MKEAFVLFMLALLILPPIIGIRRVRRVLRQREQTPSDEG